MINIIKDKEAIYETDNYDVVLVGTSTHNMLSGTFQGKIKYKYPYVDEANRKTPYGDLRKLGKRLTLDGHTPIISLMYICTYPPPNHTPYIKYDALENCLRTANEEFKGKKVITTVVGASDFDGKGDREKCLEILERCTPNLDIDVYDYEIIRPYTERNRQFLYFRELIRNNKGNKEKIAELKKLQHQMFIDTYLIKRD